jgi:hypothetical protein
MITGSARGGWRARRVAQGHDHGFCASGGWRAKSETCDTAERAPRLVIEWTTDLKQPAHLPNPHKASDKETVTASASRAGRAAKPARTATATRNQPRLLAAHPPTPRRAVAGPRHRKPPPARNHRPPGGGPCCPAAPARSMRAGWPPASRGGKTESPSPRWTPFRGYATALAAELPGTVRVLDAFHVVKLGPCRRSRACCPARSQRLRAGPYPALRAERVPGLLRHRRRVQRPHRGRQPPHRKTRRLGHGFRNWHNYRLRLLLRCGGIQWDTLLTPRIRRRRPRLVA